LVSFFGHSVVAVPSLCDRRWAPHSRYNASCEVVMLMKVKMPPFRHRKRRGRMLERSGEAATPTRRRCRYTTSACWRFDDWTL